MVLDEHGVGMRVYNDKEVQGDGMERSGETPSHLLSPSVPLSPCDLDMQAGIALLKDRVQTPLDLLKAEKITDWLARIFIDDAINGLVGACLVWSCSEPLASDLSRGSK